MDAIPIIDLALPPEEVAARVHDACTSVGFFYGAPPVTPSAHVTSCLTGWHSSTAVSVSTVVPVCARACPKTVVVRRLVDARWVQW